MAGSFRVVDVKTAPIDGQKTGTSGLRKKVAEFKKPNYLANWVQSLFSSVDGLKGTSGAQRRPRLWLLARSFGRRGRLGGCAACHRGRAGSRSLGGWISRADGAWDLVWVCRAFVMASVSLVWTALGVVFPDWQAPRLPLVVTAAIGTRTRCASSVALPRPTAWPRFSLARMVSFARPPSARLCAAGSCLVASS